MKWLLNALRTVWRWVNPTADTAQAMLIRLVAGDVVRKYIQRNPKTVPLITSIDAMIDELRKIVNVKHTTAERVIRSVILELGAMSGVDIPPTVGD